MTVKEGNRAVFLVGENVALAGLAGNEEFCRLGDCTLEAVGEGPPRFASLRRNSTHIWEKLCKPS